MDAGKIGITGTGVGEKVVERYELGADGTARVIIVNTRVGIPDLAGRLRTQTAGIEGAALKTAEFTEISGTLGNTGNTSIPRHRCAGDFGELCGFQGGT